MNLRKNSRDASRQRAQRALAHDRQPRVSLIAIPLALLLTTAVLGKFGVNDLLSAFTFPGRLTGAALVAVAFIALLGTAAVMDHWLWHRFAHSGVVAFFSSFVAFLTNFLLLSELLENADVIGYKVLFGALTIGSAWAVVAVWRTLAVIPTPKRVATALLATVVIALGNFGYQNLYLPSQREVRPTIKLTMEKPVPSNDHKAFSVPVDITLENHSEVSFNVLGTELHAMAQQVSLSPKDRLRRQWRADAEKWETFERTNPLSRRELRQPGQLVEAQPWMRYGEPIGANDTVNARVVVQLPMDTQYDQVAFYASAHLARMDRVSVERLHFKCYSWDSRQVPPCVKQKRDSDSIIYESSLRENNAIDAETRDPRHIDVYWQFGTQGANIMETISTADDRYESQTETNDRYGIRIVETGPVERILWDIKGKK
ncbi:hypothetical protein [Streptomyces sasae]|uniref:hypothetical protein n=1 Tax=Streptomyces sasae TaxID=1266772 RepID=UPI00292D743B|nr:hypothetical protein [Streptomyces sasae]